MNEFEKLVQYVTNEVIRVLATKTVTDSNQRLFIIGNSSVDTQRYFADKGYQIVEQIKEANALCLAELSVGTLSRIALMTPSSLEEETILNFLLNKQAVYIVETGREYHQKLTSCPYIMKKELLASESKWRQFGAEFIELASGQRVENKVKLISLDYLLKTDFRGNKDVLVDQGTIVTPLAKDFMREHNLQLIYKRNEE